MRPLHYLFALALAGCTTPQQPPLAPAAPAPEQPMPPQQQPLAPAYPTAEEAAAQAPASAAAAPEHAPTTVLPGGGWSAISKFNGQPVVGNASSMEYTIGHQGHSFDVQLVVFDSRQFELKVLDQPKDWSGGGRIAEIMTSAGAVAGVNGGFFTPEFKPMGLMVSHGSRTGAWQTGPLLTGAVVVSSHLQLLWNAEVNASNARELVQAGPRLVDSGQAVASLDRKKRSTRTFIATDGGTQWVIGLVHDISLSELAELLSTPGLMPAFTVNRALNLDGGHSSALYYRTVDGREHNHPGWSTVRNYLGIVPR